MFSSSIIREAGAIAAYLLVEVYGCFISVFLAVYLIFFTRFWWLMLGYLLWALVLDRETPERGGRVSRWLRNLELWGLVRSYFDLGVVKDPEARFDPKKNYLFCCFPHGLLSTGPVFGMCTNAHEKILPEHNTFVLTLWCMLQFPFIRDFYLHAGVVSVSKRSLNWILGKPGGGNVACLMVGGAQEALFCKPGTYKLFLRNRKGFVKVALRNGAPLVPVFSFGETELFDQARGGVLRGVQEWAKGFLGFSPVVPLGRGFVPFAPRKKKLTVFVGKPIEVTQASEPTTEEIDQLHKKFIQELEKLFEEQKHNYIENAQNIKLEFV